LCGKGLILAFRQLLFFCYFSIKKKVEEKNEDNSADTFAPEVPRTVVILNFNLLFMVYHAGF
jgi:uncharacterized membrane protein YiaA